MLYTCIVIVFPIFRDKQKKSKPIRLLSTHVHFFIIQPLGLFRKRNARYIPLNKPNKCPSHETCGLLGNIPKRDEPYIKPIPTAIANDFQSLRKATLKIKNPIMANISPLAPICTAFPRPNIQTKEPPITMERNITLIVNFG